LAVPIKILSNHKKSVEVCGNNVTVWTLHRLPIGVIRNLFPGCPTQMVQQGVDSAAIGFELAYFIQLSPSLKQVYRY